MSRTQFHVLQRIAWAIEAHGRDYDFAYGRGRRPGLAGIRMFCGPNALRKAMHDRGDEP